MSSRVPGGSVRTGCSRDSQASTRPAQVGQGDRHMGGAHLDAQDDAGIVLEFQHDGPAPAAEGPSPTSATMPIGRISLTISETVERDRSGLPRDFGAGNPALLPDQPQHRVGQGTGAVGIRPPQALPVQVVVVHPVVSLAWS